MTSNSTSDPSNYKWNNSYLKGLNQFDFDPSSTYTISYHTISQRNSFLLRVFKLIDKFLNKIIKRLEQR